VTKKDEHYTDAERMYVVEQMTLEEIASKTDSNERTIRRWKEEGEWDGKRDRFLDSKQLFHEELYEFARELMGRIRKDLASGEKVDTGRMYAFLRMLPSIMKVKEYEDVVDQKRAEEGKKGLTPEVVREIEEKVLGIRRE
jgi:hypothetical protein